MDISSGALKAYLTNVYFISGTPCGGKTTVSRRLGELYALPVYDADAAFERHRALSNPTEQPAMHQRFADADAFFLRPAPEYVQWLLDSTRQQLDFVLLDLIRLSQHQKVICDLHLTLDEARQLSDKSRVAFLLREPSQLIEAYCEREDHRDFKDFIESASHPARAKENCGKVLEALNRDRYERIRASDYFWLDRRDNRTAAETAALVAAHFGLTNR